MIQISLLMVLALASLVSQSTLARDSDANAQTNNAQTNNATKASDNILVGKVYDSASGAALYTERHEIVQATNGHTLHTTYYDDSGALIGEREVQYSGNRVSRYRLEQAHLGLVEVIERNAKGLSIEVVKDGKLVSKNVKHKNPQSIVIDAGFNEFVLREWKSLMSGKTVKFPVASSGQMGVVKLQIKRVDSKDSVLANAQKARFEMTTANPLFRLLLTPITIEYFTDTRELASYRGISNLKDNNLKNFNAYVEFEHDASFRQLSKRTKPIESKISLVTE